MSKKIAAGAQAIVLDVKTGSGAFMETIAEARKLASLMVSIGELSGRTVSAVISDMNQPLGIAVGNASEMKEAITTLMGEGPDDFTNHCYAIASEMLLLGKLAKTREDAMEMVKQTITAGTGLDYLRKLVEAQDGDVRFIDDLTNFPEAPEKRVVEAKKSGYVSQVNAHTVGMTAVALGAGRKKKGDPIDHAVGIDVYVKVGQKVDIGQPLFLIHARNEKSMAEAQSGLEDAVTIVSEKVEPLPLFYGLVD